MALTLKILPQKIENLPSKLLTVKNKCFIRTMFIFLNNFVLHKIPLKTHTHAVKVDQYLSFYY